MEKRRIFALLLSLCMLMMSVAALAEDEVYEEDICVDFDGYRDGLINVVREDWDGNIVEEAYNSIGLIANSYATIGEMLEDCGYHSLTPELEGDVFEGWMEYRVNIVVDEFGWEEWVYELATPDTIFSTEELMEMPTPESSVIYVAKWASIPVEEYFTEEEADWGDFSVSGCFAVVTEEGAIVFDESDELYEYISYTYWVDEGMSITDMTGEDFGWAPIVDVINEGKQFTGWTIYLANELLWTDEICEDEGVLSFLSSVWDDGCLYISIRDYSVVSENATTEELMAIQVFGENYLAVANWE